MTNVIDQTYDPAIKVADIAEHPDNPRRGSDAAVTESVEANGFFGAIIVQKSSGLILAGNTRYRSTRAAGGETIPGFWVDVDDEVARRILLADNRVSDLAYYDDTALFDLLADIQETTGDLVGTGYDTSAYELLMQSQAADEIMGGVRQGMTPADRAETYEAADVRSVILPFGGDDYDEVVDGLAALRAEWQLVTNAEVVQRLVAEARPTVAPADES